MALRNVRRGGAASLSTGLIERLAAIPAGKRAKWLVLVAWIAIVAVASPFAGRVAEVERNDDAAFLPGDAESLRVAEMEGRFADGEAEPAVVVYGRDGGLTPADLAAIEADRRTLAERFPDFPPSPPSPAEDGRAALYVVPLEDPAGESTIENVEAIRAAVGGREDGLEVKVTGPAGFLTDLVAVFDGIDGTILGATVAVVTVLLLLTYRSPFLWLVPLVAVAVANQTATAGVYGLAKQAGLPVNGQSGGLLPILVFGVGTDYALLLIARYREELRRHEDKHAAMAVALRQASPAILASATTVTIGLLCLLAADLNSNRGLGGVGAVGVVAAVTAMLTLLPAVLVLFGRRLFWPFVPRFGSATHEAAGIWSGVGRWVARRPRPVWVGTAVVLAALGLGLITLDTTLPQDAQFRTEPEAIAGQRLLAESFPAGASAPTTVIADADAAEATRAAIAADPGVADVEATGEADGLVAFAITLDAEPGSAAAFDAVERLRERVHAVPRAEALVGGVDAQGLDVARTSARDRAVVMPLVLAVVFLVLGLLLRSIVAPLVLIATVILSFGAALGVSAVVFDRLFGFAGMDPSVPLLGFVFLVALGVDYNIFLMSRVHEEAAALGTRAGMLRGLAVTGGVITSAGVVLAATFAVFTVLPLVAMIEVGFVVAFGILLDTFVVRSILVPALTLDLDRRVWWPSRLSRAAVLPSGGGATLTVAEAD